MKYNRVLPENLKNVPSELKELDSWICWKEEPAQNEQAKPRKVPVSPHTLLNASSTNPVTWSSYATALKLFRRNELFAGIGFVFAASDPYAGIDLDNCRNKETGELDLWALEFVRFIDSYTEVSPSGMGLKVFIRAKLIDKKNHFEFRGHEIEVYDRSRYFAVTGERIEQSVEAINDRQKVLEFLLPDEPTPNIKNVIRSEDALAAKVDAIPDEELLHKLKHSAQGEKFTQLMAGSTTGYSGYFAASGALCTMLAAWTRLNRERIDRLYRTSGLFEETWWEDRCYQGKRSRAELTIENSCAVAAAGAWLYDPTKHEDQIEKSIECILASKIKPEPLLWLWENRIPMGKLTVFCGVPDTGKSTVAIDIASRCTTGLAWPDCNGPREVSEVLMLISEDDLKDTVVPRLMAAGADLEKIHFAIQTVVTQKQKKYERRIALDEDLKALEETLARNMKINLIIADPLGSYLGKKKKNAEEDMRWILTELKELAERARVAVISIDHFNKKNEQSAIHRLSGAGALAAVPRAVWAFVKDADDEAKVTRLMLNAKLNVVAEAKKAGLKYYAVGAEIMIQGKPSSLPVIQWLGSSDGDLEEILHTQADPEKGKRGKCVKWLRTFLKDGAVYSREVYEAAEKDGFSERTIKRSLKEASVIPFQTSKRWKMELSSGGEHWL